MNAIFSGEFWMQKISHDQKISLLSSSPPKITDNVKQGNHSALFMCINTAMEWKLLLDTFKTRESKKCQIGFIPHSADQNGLPLAGESDPLLWRLNSSLSPANLIRKIHKSQLSTHTPPGSKYFD